MKLTCALNLRLSIKAYVCHYLALHSFRELIYD